MGRTIVIVSACLVLVTSGLVHGLWTDRWSDSSDLLQAAANLNKLPLTIGKWHGSDIDMEKDPRSTLAGEVARRYVHADSGKIVTLFLACGRSGPVCTHTPDVCYGASGYEVEQPRRFRLPTSTEEPPAEFWTARFVKERSTSKIHLRLFWSWHDSQSWKVADNPRLRFANERLLYKLYLIREMMQPDEPVENEACVEFMRELLPVLRKSVFTDNK